MPFTRFLRHVLRGQICDRYVISFHRISSVKFSFDLPKNMEIYDNRCQSMTIDNNRWRLKNTNFLAIYWSSISDINQLIVIDCH